MIVTQKYDDPCSFSNPQFFLIDHISIDWLLDFDKKTLKGNAKYTVNIQTKELEKNNVLILDSKDLNITEIREENSGLELNFELGDVHKCYGRPLKIHLNKLNLNEQTKSIKLLISYETSSNASALQWLEPNTTLGKQHPYLFSQCQAIHCRSILPCQDSPSVKFTYEANVKVKKPLVVVMSAVLKNKSDVNSELINYSFEQKIRIPSYLIAIASGDLVCKQIGPISRVWCEKEMIDKAAYEFAEVQQMLDDAQNLLGDYVWGVYDLLMLAPTFPYGGMENPCLTFVTPTLIAGDRSLASVVQHEIAHSWTGNLVTNRNWEHFWLNEGFTRFVENKLVGMFNKDEKYRQFCCIEGWRILKEEVKRQGAENPLTQLVTNLKDVDPDDSFSSIPYEKGHMFLYYLEEILGGVDVFNKYLKAHVEKFKGLSIDTDDWKTFLYEYFSDKKDILDKVDWNCWLYNPGMVPVELKFDQTLADKVIKLSEKLINQNIIEVDKSYEEFLSSQKKELLDLLFEKDPLPIEKIESLDKVYKFSQTQNSEILFSWLRLSIKAEWSPIIPLALKFVSDQGRMKFTRPIYRALKNWPAAEKQAIDNFLKQRPFMHQTTAMLVAKDLGLE